MIQTLLIAPSCPWPRRVVATAGALGMATVEVVRGSPSPSQTFSPGPRQRSGPGPTSSLGPALGSASPPFFGAALSLESDLSSDPGPTVAPAPVPAAAPASDGGAAASLAGAAGNLEAEPLALDLDLFAADRSLCIAHEVAADGAAGAAALVHIARHVGADAILTGPAPAADLSALAAACGAEGLCCIGANLASAGRLAELPAASWLADAWAVEAPLPASVDLDALADWLRTASPRLRLALPIAADRRGGAVALHPQVGRADAHGQVDLWESPAHAVPPAAARALGTAARSLALQLGMAGVGMVWARITPATGAVALAVSPFSWPLCQLGERICGIDLVEWQIRLAQGEPLPCPPTGMAPLGLAWQAIVRAAGAGAAVSASPSPGPSGGAGDSIRAEPRAGPDAGPGGATAADLILPESAQLTCEPLAATGELASAPIAALLLQAEDRETGLAELRSVLSEARLDNAVNNLPALRAALRASP